MYAGTECPKCGNLFLKAKECPNCKVVTKPLTTKEVSKLELEK